MKEKINSVLTDFERRHDCRILFAVESGSRAWGFASPDSDYDIRAVYVKPLDWYLQISEPSTDTITEMLPGDLDIVAWDIRKYLTHFAKSNASVMEWLDGPIVYLDTGIIAELNALKDGVTNPERVAFHYASMFRYAMNDRSEDGMISIKKLCYALRANLCVQWTIAHGSMPPTVFADVCQGLGLQEEVWGAIRRLLERKSEAGEKCRVVPDPALAPVLTDRYDSLASIKWQHEMLPPAEIREKLNSVFRSLVRC